MKISNRGYKIFAFLILIIIIIIILSFLIPLSLMVLFFLSQKKSKENEIQINHLLSQTYSLSNQTTYGFANFGRELAEEEYISYPIDGSTSIISNFYDQEYECSGVCYCEEDDNGRKSVSVLNRGVLIILSAVSVTMATNIAKDTFQNGCEKSFSDICPEKNIKTEVNNCRITDETIKVEEEENEELGENEVKKQKRTYNCLGHCVDNNKNKNTDTKSIDKFRNGPNVKEARETFGDCLRLQTTGIVELFITPTKKTIARSNVIAKSKFLKEYLKSFCRSESVVVARMVKSHSIWYTKEGKQQKHRFGDIETNACSATNIKYKDRSNVKCKLISKDIVLVTYVENS